MSDPDYQSLGALSPEGETAAGRQAAWTGLANEPPPPVPPIDILQTRDFSRWNRRGNAQRLAARDETNHAADFFENDGDADSEPTAGYGPPPFGQPPTAATAPAPFGRTGGNGDV